MPQQINLCTPILLTQKRYFSANTMAISLGVFVVLGAVLCGSWVWSLDSATQSLQQSVDSHKTELENLQAAILRSRASAVPVDPALLAQQTDRHLAVAQREKLKEALSQGLFQPGWGHSDRLVLVSHSIPAPVWISEVRLDGWRFEVTGYTLEPAALNEWVDKLSTSPLMQGLKLSTVRVEKAAAASLPLPETTVSAAASAPAAPTRPMWSFNLVSAEPSAPSPPSSSASVPGSKP